MVRRIALVGATVAALVVGIALPASAATVTTPVGTVTATPFALCDDLGVKVTVSVTGGFASATYRASSPGGIASSPTFTTNASGSGSTVVNNVVAENGQPSGTARVNLTVDGHTETGTITFAVSCKGGKGN